jgi:hypothetical protein
MKLIYAGAEVEGPSIEVPLESHDSLTKPAIALG